MHWFEPHMDAAWNLARWLLRDDAAAEDAVQESFVRAFTALDQFDGHNAKAWLLTIVRNRCYSWLKQNATDSSALRLDDDLFDTDALPELADHASPELQLAQAETRELLHKALAELPATFREALILKELEDLSYKEIATITQVPIGTVMSRLARGRTLLKTSLQRLTLP